MSRNLEMESSNYILDLVEIHQIYENVKKLDKYIDLHTITDLQSFNSISEDAFVEIQTILLTLESLIDESSSSNIKGESIHKLSPTANNVNYMSKIFVSIQSVLNLLSDIIQRNTERNQSDEVLNALIELNELVNITLSKTDFNIEIEQNINNNNTPSGSTLDLNTRSRVNEFPINQNSAKTNTSSRMIQAEPSPTKPPKVPQVQQQAPLHQHTNTSTTTNADSLSSSTQLPPLPPSALQYQRIHPHQTNNQGVSLSTANMNSNPSNPSLIPPSSSATTTSLGNNHFGSLSNNDIHGSQQNEINFSFRESFNRTLSDNRKSTSSQQSSSDMRHIMYMLRRMGDRQQCFTAVNLLITKLSHNDVKSTLNEMREAEALTTLLKALSKSADWPEVELHLSKAICILITHEDDATLILKNSNEILSALYMLQVKITSVRNILSSSSHSAHSSRETVFPDLRVSIQSTSSSNPASPLKDFLNNPVNGTGTNEVVSTTEMRGLIATALATIVSVLCNEWRNNGDIQQLIAMGTSSMAMSKNDVNMRPDRSRANTAAVGSIYAPAHHSDSNISVGPGSYSHSHNVNKNFAVNLESIVNIIMMVCEQPLGMIIKSKSPWSRNSSSGGASGTLTPHSTYDGKSRRNSSAVTPANASKVFFPPSFHGSNNNSNNNNMNSGNGNDIASNITYQSNDTNNNNNITPSSEQQPQVILEIDVVLLNDYIDDASTIVSASLSELAELPQCRPGIVAGGALALLRTWIENGTDIILYYKYKLFDYKRRVTKTFPREATFKKEVNDDDCNDINNSKFFQDYNLILNRLSRLLSNATCTIMYILGGSPDISKLITSPIELKASRDNQNKANAATTSNPVLNRNNQPLSNNELLLGTSSKNKSQVYGYEYMIGRIDAQVINENIPCALVHFISSLTTTLFEDEYIDEEDDLNDTPSESVTEKPSFNLTNVGELDYESILLISSRSVSNTLNTIKNLINPTENEASTSMKSESGKSITNSNHTSSSKNLSSTQGSGKGSSKNKPPPVASVAKNPKVQFHNDNDNIMHNNKGMNHSNHSSNSNFEIIREFIKKVPSLKKSILVKLKEVGLSKFVMIYIAQALYQLSSRNQNRHHLLSLQVPQTISLLLTEAVSEAEKNPNNFDGYECLKVQKARVATEPSSFYKITSANNSFDFDSNMGQTTTCGTTTHASGTTQPQSPVKSYMKNNKLPTTPTSTPVQHRNQMKTAHEKTINYEDYAGDILENLSGTWSCNECFLITVTQDASPLNTVKYIYNSFFLSNIWRNNSNNNGKFTNEITTIKISDIDTLSFLKSVSSSCLDTIVYFLNDTAPSPSPVISTVTATISPLITSSPSSRLLKISGGDEPKRSISTSGSSGTSNPIVSIEESCGNTLIDEICLDKSLRNLSFLLCSLPHCPARHSAIKIASVLSQWPKGLTALQHGHIFECLMKISQQLEYTHLTKEKQKKEREKEKEQLMIQNIHAEQQQQEISNNPLKNLMRNSRTRLLGGGNLSARDGKMVGRVGTKLDTIPSDRNYDLLSPNLRNSRTRNETVEQLQFKLMKPKLHERGTSMPVENTYHHFFEPSSPVPYGTNTNTGSSGFTAGFGGGERIERPLLRRMGSDGSEISTYSYSSFQSNSLFPTRSALDPVKVPPLLMRGVSNSSGNSDSMSELYDFPTSASAFDKKMEKNNLLLEETVSVCYTLANICQAQESFAIQLIEMGLLVTMTNLCYISTNTINIANAISVELRIQALRCISTTSYLLLKVDLNELLKGYKLKTKRFLNTILNALVSALKFQNANIQRESIKGIAGLALDENLHEAIMGDALQIIIKLILDRNYYDRDTRVSAENVSSM